ncbi:MAG: hypothetical protein NTW94_01130 [Legionellales bacterium]|nr:hypothetical protein [Legionellales bacterium]
MKIIINKSLDSMPEGTYPISCPGDFYHHLYASVHGVIETPPVADWLRRVHDLEGPCLLVSPISWQASHRDAMIVAYGESLGLSAADADAWFEVFLEFVSFFQMKAVKQDDTHWLLQCAGRPQVITKPVHQLLQQPLMSIIRTMDDTLFWPRFITEAQMFFSSHPVNHARGGLSPINGIWLWGGGQRAASVKKPLVCSSDALLQLASHLSTAVERFDPSKRYPKSSILCFDELIENEDFMLNTKNADWIWNNVAYTSLNPHRWWSWVLENIKS